MEETRVYNSSIPVYDPETNYKEETACTGEIGEVKELQGPTTVSTSTTKRDRIHFLLSTKRNPSDLPEIPNVNFYQNRFSRVAFRKEYLIR